MKDYYILLKHDIKKQCEGRKLLYIFGKVVKMKVIKEYAGMPIE